MLTSSRAALAGLSMTMLMASLDTSIANAALPALARAFDTSFESVRWVALSYLLTLTAFTVLAGRLGDRAGRRPTLLTATLVFTLASAACSVAPTLTVLIVARATQGVGAAAMTALSLAFIHEIVPAAKVGRAIGLLGTMSAIGTTLGPTLAGLLTARFGWEAIFLVNLPLGGLVLVLGARHLPGRPSSSRVPTPFDAVMWRTPRVIAGLLAHALVSTVMMTTLVVGPFHLSQSLGLGAAEMGLALSLGPFVVALSGIPAGRLIDRFGPERMTMAGLVSLAIATSLLGVLPLSAGVPGYLIAITGLTAAYAVFQTANTTRLMNGVAPHRRGAAAGALGLARNLGLVAGASVMAAIFAWASGALDVADAAPDVVAAAVRTTFRVAVLLVGVAAAGVTYLKGR